MDNSRKAFIRISAFLFKEFYEIMRQPLLLITLVLGPFLILLFFGIGFRNEPRALRTLFVVENTSSQLAQKVEEYGQTLGRQLIYEGMTSDLEEAQAKLRAGDIDLIAVLPDDPYNTIRDNQRAIFDLYHREIDPLQANYVDVFGRVYVDEVNRRVLRYITSFGQGNVGQAEQTLSQVRGSIRTLRTALRDCSEALDQLGETDVERCNAETLNHYIQDLDQKIDQAQQELGDNTRLSDATQEWLKSDTGDTPREEIRPRLENMIKTVNDLDEVEEAQTRAEIYLTQLEKLTEIETDLDAIQGRLADFVNINPTILVSPFGSQTRTITISATVTDYYGPAVIIMLLQHLTVTFAALSLVRERLLGSVELFNVSPISALETLLGKYLSYLIFGALLAVVLLALMIWGMGVPMQGSWSGIAITIVAVIFASLGIGFVISLISKTDTQAVQYAMLVLLTSVFFSGFILELRTLWQPVQIISWLLPATYGILFLRDIMLRGDPLNTQLFLGLAALGGALFVLAWWLLRRSMKPA